MFKYLFMLSYALLALFVTGPWATVYALATLAAVVALVAKAVR